MNKTLDPTADVECSRCHKMTAIWDIGTCMPCLEEQANEEMAKALKNGSLVKRLEDAKQFVFTLGNTSITTKLRREIEQQLRNLANV